MFQELREAIKTYFNSQTSDDFYTTISGNLAYSQAPSTWSAPYAVMHLDSYDNESVFRGSIVTGQVEFSCYGATAEAADDLEKTCCAMWDKQPFAFNGQTVLMQPVDSVPAERVGDDENDLWLSTIVFSIRFER